MTYDYDKLRAMVSRCKWKWATSMMDIPHEYIHRDHCALARDEFYYFVSAQRQYGIPERWGTYNFPYLYLDGYKYWTMGDPFETTWILNRQKVFDEFKFLQWPLPRIYTEEENVIMSKTIMRSFEGKRIFECGIGNGDFVSASEVKPEDYYGVEPCKEAIRLFRKNNSGFSRRCSTMSFEEAIKKWLSADSVVIALFGTASYFMSQYLGKLRECGSDFCLMFLREGYLPDEYRDTHPFPYTHEEIKRLLPNIYTYAQRDFFTCSTRQLKWFRPNVESDLFAI